MLREGDRRRRVGPGPVDKMRESGINERSAISSVLLNLGGAFRIEIHGKESKGSGCGD